jgi:dipeptidyl aminopeptidase/acylaminoacyl peptidase
MRSLAISLLLFLLLPLTAFAKASDDDRLIDQLMAVRQFSSVDIAPDGTRVAWASTGGGITVINLPKGTPQLLAGGEQLEPQFSPDSRSLAYLQEKGGQRQLYVVRRGSAPRKLTSVHGFIDSPHWSPDGTKIAFRYIEEARRVAGALAAMSRAIGVIEERIDEARIAIVDVASGKLRVVTPADMYVYEFGWSPDGKKIAATATPGSGENNYWTAKLHMIDVATATMKAVYTPKWQIANPIFSPDGSHVAIIEGLMSDQGSTGGDIRIVAVGSGADTRNLTDGAMFSATSLISWAADGITFGANMSGNSAIARIDAATSNVETLWQAEEYVTAGEVIGAAIARDGRTSVVIRSSWQTPPEVFAGSLGSWKPLTHANTIKPHWSGVKSLQWTSDGRDVQGWLILPRNYSPSRRYALVTVVHGGPSSSAMSSWPSERTAPRITGLADVSPESTRELRPRRSVHPGKHQRLRSRRSARHHVGHRRDRKAVPRRRLTPRHVRLELRRLHDDVDGHADESLSRCSRRSRHRQLAELLRTELDRSMDAAVLWRLRLRRSGRLREELTDQLHQKHEDTDARPRR